ncbi:MAG TPA: hypothetical protein VFZ02_11400 [Ktedonobacteraceae bacterium]
MSRVALKPRFPPQLIKGRIFLGCHSHITLPLSQDRLGGTLNVMAL